MADVLPNGDELYEILRKTKEERDEVRAEVSRLRGELEAERKERGQQHWTGIEIAREAGSQYSRADAAEAAGRELAEAVRQWFRDGKTLALKQAERRYREAVGER